jgi:hypothetical protein
MVDGRPEVLADGDDADPYGVKVGQGSQYFVFLFAEPEHEARLRR